MDENMERKATCAFTGHRPGALPWGDDENDPRCEMLKDRLDLAVEQAYKDGFRHYICGMAQGADFYFCESVIALRRNYADIILEAAVPFPEQSRRWCAADQARYEALLKQCDLETMIQQFYSPACMLRRNHYMVDHANRLIAVYNGNPKGSGTLGTLNYALIEGIETVILEV